jgi:phosphoadenosine phosphosulfate reductase
MNQHVIEQQSEAENWSAEQILAWTARQFVSAASLASSFGAEDVVLIDLASRIGSPFPVFTLDTDFLFPETYLLITEIEQRYGLKIDRVHPKLTPQKQARQFGDALWQRQPDQCCEIRKIEPLKRRLSSSSAWITGIRREQSPTRANARKLEWDAKFGLVKLNPLADWSEGDVWTYIRSHNVPYNPLHDQHYPSIGCTHCTRAVKPGEDARAGRWAGFTKTECGLHLDGAAARDARSNSR